MGLPFEVPTSHTAALDVNRSTCKGSIEGWRQRSGSIDVRRRTDRRPRTPRYIPKLGSHTSGIGVSSGSGSLAKIIALLRIGELGNTAFHFATYNNTKIGRSHTSWFMRRSAVGRTYTSWFPKG